MPSPVGARDAARRPSSRVPRNAGRVVLMRDGPGVRALFFAVLLAVSGYLVLLMVQPFAGYLLAALLLAFAFAPLHRRLAARIDRRLSAALVVAVAVAGVVGPLAVLAATLPADASSLSRAVRRLTSRTRLERQVERLLGVDVPLQSALADAPRRFAELLIGDVTSVVGLLAHAFLGVVLFLFLLYYLLVDGDALVAWTKEVAPLRDDVRDDLFAEASETTWAVLKGHVATAAVQGVVAGLGLLVVGLPHVVFWTVVMTFLELFPIVGVAAVLGPATLYLVLVDRLLAAGFLLAYSLTAVALVDDYFRARVVDRASSLHTGTILLGVFGGVYVFGVMGLFYGPIVLGLFRRLVELLDEHYVAAS